MPEEEPKPKRLVDPFSENSDGSDMTQREVSLGSDDKEPARIELYDPEADDEKIELKKKKKCKKGENLKQGDSKKKKKDRPPTPSNKGDPLVSKYGRTPFKEAQKEK